mgnify:CR=1 FL=1
MIAPSNYISDIRELFFKNLLQFFSDLKFLKANNRK